MPRKRAITSTGAAERKARFVEEYLKDLNGTQAAIRAGFSKASARVTASRLLRNAAVRAAIAAAKTARTERTGIDADRVLQETELLAFSDIEHYTVDPITGKVDVAEGAPRGATRAIARKKWKLKTTEIPQKGGDPMVVTEREVEVALWNKPEVLTLAGRHVDVKGFARTVEVTGKNGKPIEVDHVRAMSDQEIKARLQELAAKL